MKGHILLGISIVAQPNGKTKPGEINRDGQDARDKKILI
jgi:hypothetical protein